MFARENHLRPRGGHDHARVTFVELFFDLVFVFAVTQLSHGLLAHLTLLGVVETGLLMMAVWWVGGAHLAKRCALFVIIALGELLLVTGATFAEKPWSGPTAAAFIVAFLGSVAMWAVYFNVGAERGSRHMASASDPGRLGRNGYTYLHILIVAGIIVSAVADELALAHPDGHTGSPARPRW